MKIERKNNVKMTLAMLGVGGWFEYCKRLYVFVDDREVSTIGSDDWTAGTVFCLDDNKLYTFGLDAMVEPKKVKVVVV